MVELPPSRVGQLSDGYLRACIDSTGRDFPSRISAKALNTFLTIQALMAGTMIVSFHRSAKLNVRRLAAALTLTVLDGRLPS